MIDVQDSFSLVGRSSSPFCVMIHPSYRSLFFAAQVWSNPTGCLLRAGLYPLDALRVLRYGVLGRSSDGPSVGKDPDTTDLLRY